MKSSLFRIWDLSPVAALAAVAFVAIAVFAWAERSDAVIPDDAPWLWRAWQLGALVIAVGGVWKVWLYTRRAAWVRSLAMGVFAMVIFANTYAEPFGDYTNEVWQTVNPLFIACCSVAAVALWRCGCAAGRAGAMIFGVLGLVDFVNAYFVNSAVVWQIMNPLMTLSALSWAAGALYVNVAAPDNGE